MISDLYKIGSNASNLVTLTSLISCPITSSEFKRWPVLYIGADGNYYGDGLPTATWHFKLLTVQDIQALRQFWTVGGIYVFPSNNMAICTRLEDDTFASFTCVGHWPELGEMFGRNMFRDVTFKFTNLVLAE